MRAYRLIIVLFILVTSCKTANLQTSDASSYEEDLSHLRPDISSDEKEEIKPTIISNDTVASNNELKIALDSVNSIIVKRNKSIAYIEGYTVQVYSGYDRDAASAAKSLIERLDESFEAEITYYQPTYKVKVGEYTNKLEGHKALESLKPHFPRALLLPARIKMNYE